jgi:hypothetical protein
VADVIKSIISFLNEQAGKIKHFCSLILPLLTSSLENIFKHLVDNTENSTFYLYVIWHHNPEDHDLNLLIFYGSD